jgi:hypothetical protein
MKEESNKSKLFKQYIDEETKSAKGFRNFVLVAFAIALCIVMYFLIYQCTHS